MTEIGAGPASEPRSLAGVRVALVGKFAGMPRREAQQLLRSRGAEIAEKPDEATQWIVVGEQEFPPADLGAMLAPELHGSLDAGLIELLTETQLWQRLGFVEGQQHIHRLYTPAMLADLLGVPVAVVRRWQRRGLILPVRQVGRLPYFDFQEVATARRLAGLLASGMSPSAIEKKLARFSRLLPGIGRPLAQLSVIVEGKDLLLRQGGGLIDSAGQLRFDFESIEVQAVVADEPLSTMPPVSGPAWPSSEALATGDHTVHSADELCNLAASLEDTGDLAGAVELYRAALAAGGPRAETCFVLAELLYRLGDIAAARERYSMALELDEDYVEARANLGCVLAETGQLDLAAAAFAGALASYPDYPDAHYHLARTLDDLGQGDQAQIHWKRFLELAAESPWADMARERLAQPSRNPPS